MKEDITIKHSNIVDNTNQVRFYLVGIKTTLEGELEKTKIDKEEFIKNLDNLIEAAMKLQDEAKAEFEHKEQEIKTSIDLHQGMLVFIDEQVKLATVEGVKPNGLIASIRPLNAGLEILEKDLKMKFHKASISPQNPIIRQVMKEGEGPVIIDYIKPNGMVNNQYLASRLLGFVKEQGVASTKEMARYLLKNYPNLSDKWSNIDKGVQNILQLIKKNNLTAIYQGVYTFKKED